MMYAFPILILFMLGYMFWHASFSLRRERIHNQRLKRRLALVPVRRRNR